MRKFQLAHRLGSVDPFHMTTPDPAQLAGNFGLLMLAVGGVGVLSGTTLGKSGILRRDEKPVEYYTTCVCHLAVGAFCYLAQVYVHFH